ncbi:MAG TPA: glucosaminidase domain-containing protein [Acidimicrobiales bacterium]|nr:glucosaminidase domain-containing protein [Acidimicrobiales bacterium]
MEGRRRRPARLRRARLAAPILTAMAVVGTAVPPYPAGAATPRALDASTIRAEQDNLIAADHQGPLSLARFVVAEFTSDVAHDNGAVAADRSAQAAATARADAARARLSSDRTVLAGAVAARTEADQTLAGDRARLRVIALGMYTGALTNPQPTTLHELEAEQTKIIDAAEAQVVAGVVVGHLHADLITADRDARAQDAAARQVASDETTASQETAAAAAAAARTAVDEQALQADRSRLAGANQSLDAAEAQLTAALQSVAGPSVPPGQLSILGGSALTAAQLAGWFDSQGYVDLTSAPISQLAGWYIQAGADEGVRGDVAFAQAVLETGGFSSPDAVGLSNFAGIGHCDTCAAGWGFPSPQGGVLAQVQLLRIFADAGPGPSAAPAPVIPDLIPTRQMSAGCCSTVESLTGVWATDPGYGQQILDIYGQMLSYALSSTPPM